MKPHLPSTDPADTDDSSTYRAECYRCYRAASVCICDQVPVIENRTGVIVLQHHREVLHQIGTARIARLGLQKVDVKIACRHAKLAVSPATGPRTALLFPHSQARNLDDLNPGEFPDQLIVLDGTWAQASAMYRANSWLHDLPHLVIQPQVESNYRIRRQPRKGCLSTIEALVYALQIIEPETRGFPELLTVFDRMVDQQLEYLKQL